MLETSLNLSPISMAASFQALSDPLRIKILELLLKQELCVCDICDRLQVSQSKLSFHLKNLKEASLVKSRQDGRWIYYSLNLSQFENLEKYLSEYKKFSPLAANPCANNG
ncbi:MAG: winged helix-turn-helix transcriptional regulator [Okeania sp. SIO3B5]|uniref:ArsR/SmtB family transcription factor n=1 Tax=Okeania sp. SIO3B5 TaxID=2607811 RepID=UPI0013FF787B|nr:metalloregulator ArsR/SmtB family transcription factor [Okeania sp. SIO3B5]NEO52903.1 winged helix-turn-helix transcriptional regulator [Okeania sp. SIO3B5]